MNKHPYRALFFKEWIKLRRWGWVPLLPAAFVLANYYFTFTNMVEHRGASSVWIGTFFREQVLVTGLYWVYALAGIYWAALQLLPECSQGRLRLSMHLPVSRLAAFTVPMVVGLALMLALGAISALALLGIHTAFGFPPEISDPIIATTWPWLLAGAVVWIATAAAIAEPYVLRKALIVLLGYGSFMLLTQMRGFQMYADEFVRFVLLMAPWVTVLYAGASRMRE